MDSLVKDKSSNLIKIRIIVSIFKALPELLTKNYQLNLLRLSQQEKNHD